MNYNLKRLVNLGFWGSDLRVHGFQARVLAEQALCLAVRSGSGGALGFRVQGLGLCARCVL